MKVQFLGTASGKPSKYRNVTSIAVILEDANYILIDCGEATQHQIIKSDLKFSKILSIYITHLHGDHIFGLHGLLCSLNEIRTEALEIHGPIGLSNYVSFVKKNITNYSLLIKEYESAPPNMNTIQLINYNYKIDSCEVDHVNDRSITCFAYKITQIRNNNNLKINIAMLSPVLESHRSVIENMGYVPAEKIIRTLKENNDLVYITNDLYINPTDYKIREPNKTLIVALDNYNSRKMVKTFNSCDTLVHECTYSCFADMTNEEKMRITKLAKSHGHSTNIMAIHVANKLKCSNLILTHFSNRYEETAEQYEKIIDECLSNVDNPQPSVYCASDFSTYTI